MLGWLAQPLAYGFMQRGFLVSVMSGILCAVVGCYVVLRSMAFLGDALSHAILPGVAIMYLLRGNLAVGALVTAVGLALAIGAFSSEGVVKEDTAIAVLYAFAMSLGVVLISTMRTYALDLTHILFGNVLGVTPVDVWLTAGCLVVVLGLTALLYKEFLVVSFDKVLAATLNLPTRMLGNLMLVMLALTVVVTMQTVGVGLTTAMLVTPAATAYLVTRRLSTMMVVSACVAVFASVTGLYASYYLNIASGGAVVLVASLVFLLTYLFAPARGVLRSWWRRDQRVTAI
jgi:manganese/iron transport system permease protein